MPKAGWWIVAAMVLTECGLIALHPTWAKATMRTVYVWLWTVAPKPEGVSIPDRFL